jgi:hypothetical protein
MATTIQCPSCGRPVVTPEPTDVRPLQEQLARLEAQLTAKVDGVTRAMGSHPKPSKELLDLWANCPECKPLWNQVRTELNKQAAKNAHVRPSLSLIQEFENCPECKEAWERLKKDSPELFKPKEQAQTGTKFFWQKEKPYE